MNPHRLLFIMTHSAPYETSCIEFFLEPIVHESRNNYIAIGRNHGTVNAMRNGRTINEGIADRLNWRDCRIDNSSNRIRIDIRTDSSRVSVSALARMGTLSNMPINRIFNKLEASLRLADSTEVISHHYFFSSWERQ